MILNLLKVLFQNKENGIQEVWQTIIKYSVKNLTLVELSIQKCNVCEREWVYKQEKESERITRK